MSRESNDRSATSGQPLPLNVQMNRGEKERFGEFMVRRSFITSDQLTGAIASQGETGKRIGEVLVNLGALDERALTTALAEFFDYPISDLRTEKIEPDALSLLPEGVAREYQAVPICLRDDGLHVAVAEPSDELRTVLARVTNQPVQLQIAPSSDIIWAIDSNYRVVGGIDVLVKQFEILEGSKGRRSGEAEVTIEGDNAPIVQVVDRIIAQAVRDRASDIHIEPSDEIVRVRFRIDGALTQILELPALMGMGLVSRIKIMADMNIVERRRPQDGQLTAVVDGVPIDVRVATVATIWGETCVMRVLDKTRSVFQMSDLGMALETHEAYARLVRAPFGMVLCAGPTGSGKTTTLYATLSEVADPSRNVMTIEDPVEYVFPSINQIQTNEQAGLTFATGLKSILRQDPDVILIGEIRDVETARIAVQSALTGHFVLSCLHATDAVSSVLRFLDMGIESFLIASSMIAIVGQRLVRRICPACKTSAELSDEERAFYEQCGGPKKDVFYRGVGCNFCSGTGYKERIGVYELLPITAEMKHLIVERASEDQLRTLAKKQGMRTMREQAIQLVSEDVTTVSEVIRSIYVL
jgi:type IV pilus assembly protein PilB